jgi:hypothetical protein
MAATELTERPDHIPADRVVDFDVYNPAGVEHVFQAVFQQVHDQNDHNLVWTPRNEGHSYSRLSWLYIQVARLASNFSADLDLDIESAVGVLEGLENAREAARLAADRS